MAAFMGMRGTGDWATYQRPENWRQVILREFPNGSAPITAMTALMGSESTDDPTFHWWTKRLPSQGGDVTSVYIDSGLATEYVYGSHQTTHGTSGDTIYVKVAEALAKEFRDGHEVVLRDVDRYDVDIVGKVVDVVYNGASSYVAVKLHEADDNSATSSSYNLATVDRIIIIGNVNPEGGAIPRAVGYDPVHYYNYTQIFRTALEISRTAKKTKLRTGDAYQEMKREALELHSIEMEKALIWGVRAEGTGSNDKPERSFGGLLWFLRTYATSNLSDFRLESAYSADSWSDSGENWFDAQLETLGAYAPPEVIGFCGGGALTGISQLAKTYGNIQLTPKTKDYGLDVVTWINPHVTVHLKKHPLLSRESSTSNSMILMAPKNLKMRPLDDTMFKTDREARGTDGSIEEFLSEIGPEFHFPDQFMFLDGIGEDNPGV